jgi:putative DNA primase/helicase
MGISAHKKTDATGRTIWALDRCLTSDAHRDGACLTLAAGGQAGYKCHHDTCAGANWAAVKPVLFPDRIKAAAKNGSGEGKPVKPTDDILRDRWIAKAGRVVFGLGDFRRYRAGLWPVVKREVVKREITQVLVNAKPEGIAPTAYLLNSVSELIKNELTVPDDSIFDGNPDYLVCTNGALYIPTRQLQPHNPDLYATAGVDYDFAPDANAPNWLAFLMDLESTLGLEVVEFLQEFTGYSLTTDTSHELAVWLYGPPGGGKSTFITGLQAMLGNRAGLLGLAAIERSRFALGNLPGKTLMLATEQPAMFIRSTDVLNAIISGEPVTIEWKFSNPFEVTPRAKILWAMNELPRVQEAGNGIFRRVKVVEFPAIPESEKDPLLKEGIKGEGAGILNWALAGLDRLKQRGYFAIPEAVKAATDDFKQHNDIAALFIQEACAVGFTPSGDPYRTQTGQLYERYKQWCLDNGHKPKNSTNIGGDWKRLGFEKRRPGGIVYWYGVGILDVNRA